MHYGNKMCKWDLACLFYEKTHDVSHLEDVEGCLEDVEGHPRHFSHVKPSLLVDIKLALP